MNGLKNEIDENSITTDPKKKKKKERKKNHQTNFQYISDFRFSSRFTD